MSKIIEKLRERRVYNPHDFYGDRPYIGFRANQGSRDVFPSCWRVHKRNMKLSDDWYDYGAKSFTSHGRGGRKEALIEAQAWASEKFGVGAWARDPFGSYGDAQYVKEHLAFLLALPVHNLDKESL